MASRRFRELEARLKALDSRLLPTPNPTHLYSDEEYDRVRGYLLLCHAEVESCIEALAWATLDLAYTRWSTTGRSSRVLISVLAFDQRDPVAPAQSFTSPPKKPPPDLADRVTDAHGAYRTLVKANHGVKEQNLLRLLLPLGVQEIDFPPGWLSDMSTFGSDRGEIAHHSVGMVRQPPDPTLTKGLVNRVLAGLKSIDSLLAGLRR